MTSDGAASRLFVYGTLLMPAVLHAVCGRAMVTRAATLPDFARYRLQGRVYPAIIAEPGARTTGLVCEGMDSALWQHLDDWESPLYTRLPVTLRNVAGDVLDAETYVLAAHHHHEIERAAWSPEDFERLHLAAYLARWTTPSS